MALVTGGSRGIGAAIARRLATDGADVALSYRRDADQAAAVVAEIEGAGRRGLVLPADSRDAGQVVGAVEQTVAELGRLDVLVNNAGIFPIGPLEDVTLEELDHTLAVHARAVILAAQAAARHLGAGGRIITIGSCFVERVPYPGISLYAMSKSALTGLTKGLARDLGERDITANLVHPGSTEGKIAPRFPQLRIFTRPGSLAKPARETDTEMNPADGVDADAERAYIALGRYARAEEIAATVAHLAGESGRYITGASIAVDGGFAA